MKAVVLAYSNIGCTGIEALLKHGFDIAAVFTHKDNPTENIWFDSVAQLAASKNLEVFAPEDINHPIWVNKIKEIKPDIIFSFYYRNMVKPEILSIPPGGCLNLHGSLLPAYRGRCPINWVLVNGETATGVTLHYMTAKPDDGDIVAQKTIDISDEDTAGTLHLKARDAASLLLDDALPQIKNGSAPHSPQDHSKSSYYGGRRPGDGEIDWNSSAKEVRNLVRAVTQPYPGAFSHVGARKCIFWSVTEQPDLQEQVTPGTIISTDPLVIACDKGAVQVDFCQPADDIYMTGAQMAQKLNLVEHMAFGPSVESRRAVGRVKKILILGVNGFIGNALGERLLEDKKYEVHGMDLQSDKISALLGRSRFHFDEGDISIHREWIEYHINKCDIVVPLVAIATPIEYTRNPLRVFELDFEENLKVIRHCVRYGKRIIFPSTSEVYGMCDDDEFDENNSRLITGPIRMQRWIYSCIKQLLDRVIWAYGEKQGLQFTLFRPFNWIGPKLDSLSAARIGSSRVITQLILNLVEGSPIQLVDGGEQKRCFTDVSDGVECLYRIIENRGSACNGQIINIGNPNNEASIREIAEILVAKFDKHPLRDTFPPFAGYHNIESGSYYGAGYQDMQHRTPSIKNAKRLLDWTPLKSLEESVEETLDYFLQEAANSRETTGS